MAIELGQVTSLADVIQSNHFELLIPTVPGGGDGQSLNIRNMTAILPGRKNDPIQVELHRHKVNFAGKRTYGNSFAATYVESSDRAIWSALLNWQNQMTDPSTGLPRPKSDYATVGVVNIYDSSNAIVESRTFYGLFVSGLDDASLNGSGTEVLTVSAQFSYDYWQ